MSGTYATGARYLFGMAETFRIRVDGCVVEETWAHPGLELTLPLAGRERLGLRGRNELVGPGTLSVFNGRELHTNRLEGAYEGLTVIIPPAFVDDLVQEFAASGDELAFAATCQRPTPRTTALIADLFAVRDNPALSPFAIDCLASELTLETLTAYRHSHRDKLYARRTTGHFPGCIAKAKRVLYDRLTDPTLRLDDVARHASISKYHLVRAFRARTGLSPMQYRSLMRLELVKSELLRGRGSISDLALSLGFADLSTFNKQVKRALGLAPHDFRRRRPPRSPAELGSYVATCLQATVTPPLEHMARIRPESAIFSEPAAPSGP